MARKGIALPTSDEGDATTVAAWKSASESFARGASSDINAAIGSKLRPGGVWETVELSALKANPLVTSITTIDPAPGLRTVIFKR